jgi:geranylgeranyl pyrophosphate synthase
MTETASLYGPVAEEIPAVAERLRHLASGHHPLLGETLAYVFQTTGKHIRPALVLLSGKLGAFHRERLITLAASLEVVHTATLVHDDTIDQALSRRGLSTINAVWNRKVAILIGDFLFAQSAHLAAQLNSVPIMSLLSETVMAMSSGELRQYAASQDRLIDESDYFERIAGKTASLFAMCCEGAGVVSEQGADAVAALREYGTNLGLAFQIADDVLDFVGDAEVLGKPAGGDLREGTITLPVIIWAAEQNASVPMLAQLKRGDDVEPLIEAIRESDAPDRALQRAEEYAERARESLRDFAESEAKESLIHLTTSVVHRSR